MDQEIDYDAEEAALDAEIASMLKTSPEAADTDDEEEQQTEAEPTNDDVDTSAVDQNEDEQQAEPTVPESRYKNLQAKMTQVSQENADLRRYLTQLQEQVNQLQAQSQQQQSAEPDTDADDLDALTADYPEIATPLVKRNKLLEKKLADLEAKLNSVSETTSRVQQSEARNEAERYWNEIRKVHGDVDDIRNDEAFTEWAETQPPVIQHCVKNGCSVEDALMVFDLYKKSKGIGQGETEKPDRLAEAKQAASPKLPKNPGKPTSNKTNFTRDQIAKMSMADWEKHEAEIDEAIANGTLY